MAAWTALQFHLDGTTFSATGLPWYSFARATPPAATGSALLLALVLWAQPLTAAALQADLKRMLTRALLVTIPGYVVAAVVSLAIGYAFLHAYGLRRLGVMDFVVGAAGALLDGALCVFLAWRFLARLRGARLSLPAKLAVVLTVTVPLRAMCGLIFASWLPG
jgi:hypothetical protein